MSLKVKEEDKALVPSAAVQTEQERAPTCVAEEADAAAAAAAEAKAESSPDESSGFIPVHLSDEEDPRATLGPRAALKPKAGEPKPSTTEKKEGENEERARNIKAAARDFVRPSDSSRGGRQQHDPARDSGKYQERERTDRTSTSARSSWQTEDDWSTSSKGWSSQQPWRPVNWGEESWKGVTGWASPSWGSNWNWNKTPQPQKDSLGVGTAQYQRIMKSPALASLEKEGAKKYFDFVTAVTGHAGKDPAMKEPVEKNSPITRAEAFAVDLLEGVAYEPHWLKARCDFTRWLFHANPKPEGMKPVLANDDYCFLCGSSDHRTHYCHGRYTAEMIAKAVTSEGEMLKAKEILDSAQSRNEPFAMLEVRHDFWVAEYQNEQDRRERTSRSLSSSRHEYVTEGKGRPQRERSPPRRPVESSKGAPKGAAPLQSMSAPVAQIKGGKGKSDPPDTGSSGRVTSDAADPAIAARLNELTERCRASGLSEEGLAAALEVEKEKMRKVEPDHTKGVNALPHTPLFLMGYDPEENPRFIGHGRLPMPMEPAGIWLQQFWCYIHDDAFMEIEIDAFRDDLELLHYKMITLDEFLSWRENPLNSRSLNLLMNKHLLTHIFSKENLVALAETLAFVGYEKPRLVSPSPNEKYDWTAFIQWKLQEPSGRYWVRQCDKQCFNMTLKPEVRVPREWLPEVFATQTARGHLPLAGIKIPLKALSEEHLVTTNKPMIEMADLVSVYSFFDQDARVGSLQRMFPSEEKSVRNSQGEAANKKGRKGDGPPTSEEASKGKGKSVVLTPASSSKGNPVVLTPAPDSSSRYEKIVYRNAYKDDETNRTYYDAAPLADNEIPKAMNGFGWIESYSCFSPQLGMGAWNDQDPDWQPIDDRYYRDIDEDKDYRWGSHIPNLRPQLVQVLDAPPMNVPNDLTFMEAKFLFDSRYQYFHRYLEYTLSLPAPIFELTAFWMLRDPSMRVNISNHDRFVQVFGFKGRSSESIRAFLSQWKCGWCGEKGRHFDHECTVQLRCGNCGSYGHLKEDCSKVGGRKINDWSGFNTYDSVLPPHAQIGKGNAYRSYASIKRDTIETGREPAIIERTHEAIFAYTPDEFVAWVNQQVRDSCQGESDYFIPRIAAAHAEAERDGSGQGPVEETYFQPVPRAHNACLHCASLEHFTYQCPYKRNNRNEHELAWKQKKIPTPMVWDQNDREAPLWTVTPTPLWYDQQRPAPFSDLLVETCACWPEPGVRPSDQATWSLEKAFSMHVLISETLEDVIAWMNLGYCPTAQVLVAMHRSFCSVRRFRMMLLDGDTDLPKDFLMQFRDHFRSQMPQLFGDRSPSDQELFENRGNQRKFEFPPEVMDFRFQNWSRRQNRGGKN